MTHKPRPSKRLDRASTETAGFVRYAHKNNGPSKRLDRASTETCHHARIECYLILTIKTTRQSEY